MLSLVGGLIGYAIASWGGATLIELDPSSLPGLDRVRPDVRSFGFAVAVSALTGLLFGLLPVTRIPKQSALSLMGRAGRGSIGGPEARRVLSGLVVGQVALATTVIVAAGLFARSRSALTAVDPGFTGDGALVFDLQIPSARYADLPSIDAFWAGLTERLEGLPGVRSVGVARSFPLRAPERREYILLDGRSTARSSDEPAPIVYQAARPGFLETMGVSLREGRFIEASDRADAPYVVVVSESAATAYWPDGAIGARFHATFAPDEHPEYTIVGVVADVTQSQLDVPPSPQIYIPLAQTPVPGRGWVRRASVVVRADSDPRTLVPAIRGAVAELEPRAPIENMATLTEVLRGATARSRFLSVLVGAFGALALLVAAVGVYGTVSFAVARRRREFGVRAAMGEGPRSLVSRVLLSSLRPAVVGISIGLVGAWVVGPALSSLLFSVGARDLVAFTLGPVAALATASLAAAVPARRAIRIAPLESLRDPA
jgi:putative ABC transport system permease protein